MNRKLLVSVGIIAALAISGVAAAPTSATINKEWYVVHDYGTVCWESAPHHITCITGLTTLYAYSTATNTKAVAAEANTFTHVETTTGVSCNSAGAAAGEVRTEPVVQEVGYISKAKKEVGLEERPAKGGILAKFTCGEEEVELEGAVIGRLSPTDTKVKHSQALTDTIALDEGKQAITKFEGGPTAVLQAQTNGGGFHEATDEDTAELTPAEGTTLEVKTTKKTVELRQKKAKKEKH